MANRLTRITTRTGDGGTTRLADGREVPKSAPVIAALGDLDELSAALGVALAEPLPDDMRTLLLQIQNDLFEIGSELALPEYACLQEPAVALLEQHVEQWNSELPPLKEFLLPGGTRAAALLHVARTVCRRMERTVTGVGEPGVSPAARRYANRLSDLLFVAARRVNRLAGSAEPMWQRHPRIAAR